MGELIYKKQNIQISDYILNYNTNIQATKIFMRARLKIQKLFLNQEFYFI